MVTGVDDAAPPTQCELRTGSSGGSQVPLWFRNARAGTPATISPGLDVPRDDGAGADERARPDRTPPSTTAPEPIDAPSLDDRLEQRPVVRSACSSPSVVVARGLVVDEHHAVPDEDVVADATPSQTNVWLWILQRAPIGAPRWISTNGPIRVSSPIAQP